MVPHTEMDCQRYARKFEEDNPRIITVPDDVTFPYMTTSVVQKQSKWKILMEQINFQLIEHGFISHFYRKYDLGIQLRDNFINHDLVGVKLSQIESTLKLMMILYYANIVTFMIEVLYRAVANRISDNVYNVSA